MVGSGTIAQNVSDIPLVVNNIQGAHKLSFIEGC